MKRSTYGTCVVLAGLLGCSDNHTGHEGQASAQPTQLLSTASTSAGTNNAADQSPADFGRPMSITVAPDSPCVAHPEGVSSPAVSLAADGQGRVRFFPPPGTWGSRLAFDCTVGGTVVSTLVDVNDSSTFSLIDTTPRVLGVRPPLTGDLMAPSRDELLHRGYGLRPDPSTDPTAFSRWKDMVSRPMTHLAGVGATVLGTSGDPNDGLFNQYIQTVSPYAGYPGWSGQIMDAQGFSGSNPILNGSTKYYEYEFWTLVPSTQCTAACASSIWGGIGGYTGGDGPLLQSGVWADGNTCITTGCSQQSPYFWYQFAWPGNSLQMVLGTLGKYSLNDEIYTIGYGATDSNCGTTDANAAYGCFYFYDMTNGWYMGTFPYQRPSGTTFVGGTFESIVEAPNPGQLFANYGETIMQVDAYDTNGSKHTDLTDAFILRDLFSSTTGDTMNKVWMYGDPGYYPTSPTQWDIGTQWFNYQ